MEPLRIGVLGAARIAGAAIAAPARLTGARLVAVAARDRDRALAFAGEHGVERVLGSYAEVIADPEVEAVYNPLANSLHGPWNRIAVEAGKHVLTEKPSASDAAEAREVRDAALKAGVLLMEGFHYLYHPVTRRLLDAVASGEIGELRGVEVHMEMPSPADGDPRWSLELAGGTVMDVGCYGLHLHRVLGRFAGGEPTVTAARGRERAGAPGVDESMEIELAFPSGLPGLVRTSMTATERDFSCRVVGSRGEVVAPSFVLPHLDDRVLLTVDGQQRVEELGRRSSYAYQLEAFAAAVRAGGEVATGADDAVASAELIDAAYRAAGFPLRPRTSRPAP
ncbi:Gfo/Idh/MocA family protein [Pseudonocardia humida]|uniref:Gfo/Idh/MocA family oxidoreductase n=1 Tax=Pseudonocardia humida TaxID=2800819 RepID=A0ABT1A9M0_9PSEU|nr:Gfo/Idh/MocA family oxidoreductase [Pseudonocardia humida]MCO1659630.1 Gfo/Idh/MocA family oxidoreductase [Pseudonocardia humida]